MSTRWQQSDAPRGVAYDAKWASLAASGQNVHGEADLVEELLAGASHRTVLDAGCGTGRVAIELARRGFSVTGIDADADMLAGARAKAPEISWRRGDLAEPESLSATRPVDLVLLAGNVMIFLAPGTEADVVANLAGCLKPAGLLVAGFSLRPAGLTLSRYNEIAAASGLQAVARWSTWDRLPFTGGDYAVSVHRAAVSPHGKSRGR